MSSCGIGKGMKTIIIVYKKRSVSFLIDQFQFDWTEQGALFLYFSFENGNFTFPGMDPMDLDY